MRPLQRKCFCNRRATSTCGIDWARQLRWAHGHDLKFSELPTRARFLANKYHFEVRYSCGLPLDANAVVGLATPRVCLVRFLRDDPSLMFGCKCDADAPGVTWSPF